MHIFRYTSLSGTTASATSTSVYSVMVPNQLSMFSIETFEDRLRQHLQETYNVRAICERHGNTNENMKGAKNSIRIKITGQTDAVESAIHDLENLFSSLCTKKFDERTGKNCLREIF